MPTVLKSGNLNLLEPSGPVQAFTFFTLHVYVCICVYAHVHLEVPCLSQLSTNKWNSVAVVFEHMFIFCPSIYFCIQVVTLLHCFSTQISSMPLVHIHTQRRIIPCLLLSFACTGIRKEASSALMRVTSLTVKLKKVSQSFAFNFFI